MVPHLTLPELSFTKYQMENPSDVIVRTLDFMIWIRIGKCIGELLESYAIKNVTIFEDLIISFGA